MATVESIFKVARVMVNLPTTFFNKTCGYSKKEPDPPSPTMYENRKVSPNLPEDSVCPPFEYLPGVPTGVFRCTCGETLGPCAHKYGIYKNPEYFSYHDMTFFDFQHILEDCRTRRICSTRKPISF